MESKKTEEELNKKIKYLHNFANWGLTPLVVIFIVVYFLTKPTSIWTILLALLVVFTTFIVCVMALVYIHQKKKLQKQNDNQK
ncbi:hypothetical protein [Fructilactobacillus fructivorans]|uniref:Uncharacterized protein n=1 Tax=Fructilactobacillus fructivorans TaxID=1614 RepID=A0A0C1PQW8_9LACO|nr:hypothetical protein [Fructilactobacillus fructivorans]KID42271.1 hypothetical protein LfDm3_0200 [Fructilactobacillus fructivorans]KRK58232.1 hypothetical protein FC73_GL000614 [Fructilactobacillus fructivorans]KRN40891.1 hypothetical protein IV51_GL001119 [Fructilactobacillus fructivorans]KRN42486.1 hypothetical protein IV48_GL000250 [Fructilactobacillus fructivorans]MCT0151108.1 hypothetical protein [Fructilactobacillus fructivorans]